MNHDFIYEDVHFMDHDKPWFMINHLLVFDFMKISIIRRPNSYDTLVKRRQIPQSISTASGAIASLVTDAEV